MMGRLQQVGSARRPCRGWTWRLCHPASVHGRTAREPETPERESPRELTEVDLRGRTVVTARLDEVDEVAGVPGEDQDLFRGEEDRHPEDHRGGAAGAGSPEDK